MPSPARHRILVVDYDLRLRDLLKRYLTEQGFAVETVPDGAAMDHNLKRTRYDLVVLDLMLPGEDGLALCRRLRGWGNDIPIVMLTAKGDDVDRIVGEMGADDYLPKPFNPRELVGTRDSSVYRRSVNPRGPNTTVSLGATIPSLLTESGQAFANRRAVPKNACASSTAGISSGASR